MVKRIDMINGFPISLNDSPSEYDLNSKVKDYYERIAFKINNAMENFMLKEVQTMFENDKNKMFDMVTYNINIEKIYEAIQKQIPKKIVTTTSTIRCPCCNKQITNRGCIKANIKFCSKCGQALDWSKDE